MKQKKSTWKGVDFFCFILQFTIKKLNNEYILADEHKLNELVYAFYVDKENNIYFGNYVYSSIEKELRELILLDKTALSITVDKNNNVYYSTVIAGVYFLKIKQNRLEKLIFLELLSIQLLLTKMIIFSLIIMKVLLFFKFKKNLLFHVQ